MSTESLNKCRKCGTSNRADNAYCRKCGAVLYITTTQVNAQPKPVMPDPTGLKWRFIWLGVFVMLGLVSALLFFALFLGSVTGIGANGLSGLVEDLFRLVLLTGVLFFVAFGLSGLVMAWLSKRSVTKEVVIASSVVVALLGAAGSTLTTDLLVVAGMVLPLSAAAAWLGAKLVACRKASSARGSMPASSVLPHRPYSSPRAAQMR